MRRLLGLLLLATACHPTTTTTISDFGLVTPGCRFPSACFSSECGCTRQSVAAGGACLPCQPQNGQSCDCSMFPGTACLEQAQVCVGRAAAPCPGQGARCLPAGSSCTQGGGVPPDLTVVGGTGQLEPHCSFVDDVCCAGTPPVDAGIPADANVDQLISD